MTDEAAPVVIEYTYDEANRLTEVDSVAYTWDDNGNLLSDGANTFAYDHANRLIGLTQGAQTYSFAYNGLGDRLQQSVGEETTTYSLDLNAGLTQVLADGTNTYLYGMGRVAQYSETEILGLPDPITGLPQVELLETWLYYLPDALGSVRQLADEDGAITLAQSFEPYGETLGAFGNQATSYGFAGEQTDATGMQYLRARYYAPDQGRFITIDAFEGMATLPASYHPYQYAFNNPVIFTDPGGKFPQLVAVGLLGALIGAVGGGIYTTYTYDWAIRGECGCDMQIWALQTDRTKYIATVAGIGGILGGVATAIAATGPAAATAIGAIGATVSLSDFIATWRAKAGTHFNKCELLRLGIDLLGVLGSAALIRSSIRAINTVPGGGLTAHELAGGHTISRHVGQTQAQLLSRLRTEPNIRGASTFFNEASAESAIAQAINANNSKISSWLGGSRVQLGFSYEVGRPVGIFINRGMSQAIEVSRIQIFLIRDTRFPLGYRIQTSYPIP